MNRALVPLALVAAFAAGCATTLPPPRINTLYTVTGTPTPRSDSALVEVFMKENPPTREYDVLGQVEISTERESRTMENMLEYARHEARKLGGDALIGLDTNATPTPAGSSYTYPVRNLYTGEVIGYRTASSGPGEHRIMKATVVKWRDRSDPQAAHE
jgi:hypothetical protein